MSKIYVEIMANDDGLNGWLVSTITNQRIATKEEVKELIKTLGLKEKKQLSENFLVADNGVSLREVKL